MPRYSFTIIQGGESQPSNIFDCKDDRAAKKEASDTFADMSRDISKRMQLDGADWQIEVADAAGKSLFKIKVATESK
jgi:hypothetical protein